MYIYAQRPARCSAPGAERACWAPLSSGRLRATHPRPAAPDPRRLLSPSSSRSPPVPDPRQPLPPGPATPCPLPGLLTLPAPPSLPQRAPAGHKRPPPRGCGSARSSKGQPSARGMSPRVPLCDVPYATCVRDNKPGMSPRAPLCGATNQHRGPAQGPPVVLTRTILPQCN